MTAQARERINYLEEQYGMASLPLNQYFSSLPVIPEFGNFSTACWRGYVGEWEIKENRLYLINLNGYNNNQQEVGLDYLFPKQKEVFAEWYNGEVRIEKGERLEYVHQGFGSVFEENIFLEFENGILINTRTVNNKENYKPESKAEVKSKSFWNRLFGKH